MKFLITIISALIAGPAVAHTGHLIEVAGHDHVLIGAALAAAAAAALWGALKGDEDAEEAEEADTEEEIDAEPQEA